MEKIDFPARCFSWWGTAACSVPDLQRLERSSEGCQAVLLQMFVLLPVGVGAAAPGANLWIPSSAKERTKGRGRMQECSGAMACMALDGSRSGH